MARKQTWHARALTVLAGLACLAVMTACSPGGSGPSIPSQSATPTSAVPSEPVTLSIAYCDAHPVEDLIAGFTALYPNVTFDTQYEDCNSFSSDIVNKLTSSNPPDITEYVDSAIQTVAPQGLVLDLGPYADLYGWKDKFPASELAQLQLSDNGSVHGEGRQLGIPGGASFVGVFYNKALLSQAGLAVPTTLDEFTAALQTAREAGIVPIALGAQDDGGIHLWGSLVNSLIGPKAAQDWVNGKAGSTLDLPGVVQASQMMTDWTSSGYFTVWPNGTSENDARAAFAAGSALFTVDGSWSMGTIPPGDAFGFFPFPGAKASDPVAGQGFSAAFAISSKSPNADVAAAFLDYLASPEAAKITVSLGMLPVNVDTAPAPDPGLATDLRNGYAAAAKDDGIVTFYDHATPTMHTTLTMGIQGLIIGESTPEDFINQVQTDWGWSKG